MKGKSKIAFGAVISLLLSFNASHASASDKAVPVEVKNKRNQAVYVRNNINRYPVYCSARLEPLEYKEFSCKKSVHREALGNIPKNYRLVITGLSAEATPFGSGEESSPVYVGVGNLTGAAIGEPGLILRGSNTNGDDKHFNTPFLVLNQEDTFGVRNFSGTTTSVAASGYLIKSSDLKRAF